MAFPKVFSAVSDMVPKVALEASTARDVARKAGLKQGSASIVGSTRIRTLIDEWIEPSTAVLINQWYVDLTGYTRIRFSTQSLGELVAPFYSLSDSSVLDPGDWQAFALVSVAFGAGTDLRTERVVQSVGEGLLWAILPPELQRSMRLTIGFPFDLTPTPFQIHPEIVDGPFNIHIQVF